MAKRVLFAFTVFLLLVTPVFGASQPAKPNNLSETLSGRILLQVESYGRAWYVNPVDKQRYYIKDGNAAYEIMRSMGLGISNKDLDKIPAKKGQAGDAKLVSRLKGRILLQVQNHGEAWYLNPVSGLRYYLKDGEAAYRLMKEQSLGINNGNLAKIPMNRAQIAHDTTFNDVAHVRYDGKKFDQGYNDQKILPLASLTKLMTALVVLDTNPDWSRKIIITKNHLNYPRLYAPDDATSEVGFKEGDVVSAYDLWVAMLVASSNQAAVALAESTGLNQNQFVAKMNDKAKALGLDKTLFYDVAGLDPHNVTTAREMALIAYQAFNQPKIVAGCNQDNYNINALSNGFEMRTIKVANRNTSLMKFEPQAAKVGYLIEAKMTVALKKSGKVIVVMHASGKDQRNALITKLLP